jgi:penicillin amidase
LTPPLAGPASLLKPQPELQVAAFFSNLLESWKSKEKLMAFRTVRIAAAVTLLVLVGLFARIGAQHGIREKVDPIVTRSPTFPEGIPASPSNLEELARQSLAKIDGVLGVPGLKEPVDVVRDRWGVPHIYARNVDDLFFAQGYVIGQDRLWQMEMWRRQREGRLSEILGPAAFERDRQARLLMYRGPFDDAEWTSYHPEGKRIFTAFAAGVNAFITQNLDNLPVEFKLTGIKPELWKPETVLLRTTGFGDGSSELQLAQLVARVGVKEANRQRMPDPWDELTVPEGLDVGAISDEAVAAGRGGGGRGMPTPAIVDPYRSWLPRSSAGLMPEDAAPEPGSNNWVMAGSKTETGKPLVSNDPHREVTNPSLRYIMHLAAPGWNVIGSQEPPFVGIAIGHNERLAWGLTITGTDQHDVYVEELNPANENEVRFKGAWEPLKVVREEIPVNGEAPRAVVLKFSRHGPIFFTDTDRHRAYALRSVMNEPGTAPYLGGLRLAQARDCRSFLDAAMYWKTPTENLICGDVDGNISFQASALTPNRKGWLGRLPVPGTGTYEWDGFRAELPRILNPQKGYIATANNNIHSKDYWPPVMFKTLNGLPFERITRVEQVINSILAVRKWTIEDSKKLQHDPVTLRGAYEADLFRGWTAKAPESERARAVVAGWDGSLDVDSAAAAIHTVWRTTVDPRAMEHARPREEKLPLVEPGLVQAVAQLTKEQGADPAAWRYGRVHRRDFPHPLVAEYDLPTVERSGGTGAVMADGASYREIIDVADWDRSVVTNVPGQSGQPGSPFYGSLLPLWAKAEYFPLVFSRSRVDREASHKLSLRPAPASSTGSARR